MRIPNPESLEISPEALSEYLLTGRETPLRQAKRLLKERPERLVFIGLNKLVGQDVILPVAMEIKAENPDLPMSFLFSNQAHQKASRDNYILWNGMKRIGPVRHLLDDPAKGGWRRWAPLRRLVYLLRLLREIRACLRRRTLLIHRGDFSGFPLIWLAIATRRGGGALLGYPNVHNPFSCGLARYHLANASQSHFGEPISETLQREDLVLQHLRFQADANLIFHPLQMQWENLRTTAPKILIGTPRRFPAWIQYLEEAFKQERIVDIDGAEINAPGVKNLLLFYAGPIRPQVLQPHRNIPDGFHATLRAVRRIGGGLRLVIKPGATCDLEALKAEIGEYPDLDLRISYAHALVLARHCVGAVVNNPSAVAEDMFMAGVTVLETFLLDPALADHYGNSLYPNPGGIDCSDDAVLEQSLIALRDQPDALPRPTSNHLVWPKAPSLSALIWGG